MGRKILANGFIVALIISCSIGNNSRILSESTVVLNSVDSVFFRFNNSSTDSFGVSYDPEGLQMSVTSLFLTDERSYLIDQTNKNIKSVSNTDFSWEVVEYSDEKSLDDPGHLLHIQDSKMYVFLYGERFYKYDMTNKETHTLFFNEKYFGHKHIYSTLESDIYVYLESDFRQYGGGKNVFYLRRIFDGNSIESDSVICDNVLSFECIADNVRGRVFNLDINKGLLATKKTTFDLSRLNIKNFDFDIYKGTIDFTSRMVARLSIETDGFWLFIYK